MNKLTPFPKDAAIMKEERSNAQNSFEQNDSTSKFTGSPKDTLQGKPSDAKHNVVESALSYGDGSQAITPIEKGNSAEFVFNAPNDKRNASIPFKADDITVRRIDDKIKFKDDLSREELESMFFIPIESAAEDMLKLKGMLEKEFFGKAFPNSNIYIQLIDNILDIQKILGRYINSVIFTINNLQALESKRKIIKSNSKTNNVTEEPFYLYDRICYADDVLGSSLKSEARQKDILAKLQPYLGLFGDTFQIPKNERKNDALSSEDKYNVNVLKVLSALRHWTSHWGSDIVKRSYPFFDKDKSGDQLLRGVKSDWGVVAANYKNKIDRVNKSFLDNSKKNVKILYGILHLHSDAEKKELVQDFYNYTIVKQGRNLGLNIVKLRECIIDKYYPEVKDKICDPHRSTIYTIADFLLYRHLKHNPKVVSQAAVRLEYSINKDQKTDVYERLASNLRTKLENQLTPFFKASCAKCPEYLRSGKDVQDAIPSEWIDSVKLKSEDGIPFVMLLSLMCNFLQSRDCNELLTAFIHIFENIQSFIDTLTKLGEPVQFTQPYSAFNSMNNQYAREAARQLRALANVDKKKPDLSGAKRPLYVAAIQILGDTDEPVSDAFIEKNILLDRSNKTEYALRKEEVNSFRNFIVNNVIESWQFKYLPKAVRKLMNNASIVRYTLSRMSENQIDNYYSQTLPSPPNANREEKLDILTRVVTGLTFQTVMDYRKAIVVDPKNKPVDVERLKVQIKLYLRIAYIAIKELVKINARYYNAYQILERETELLNKKVKELGDETAISKHYIQFNKKTNRFFGPINYFLEREDTINQKIGDDKTDDEKARYAHLNKLKNQRLISPAWQKNFKNEISESLATSSTGFLPVVVRNMTEHLNVLALIQDYVEQFRKDNSRMKSYFELYHFLMQSMLFQIKELNLETYRKSIENGIADDRLVQIAYVPFGYNLARYKKLTTDAQIDKSDKNG